jgi:hypothetical protein
MAYWLQNKNSSHKLMLKTTFIKYKTQISQMKKIIENLMIFQWTQIRNENTLYISTLS